MKGIGSLSLFCLLCWLLLGCSQEQVPGGEDLLRDLNEVQKLDLLEVRTEETIIVSGSPYTLASIRSLDDAAHYVEELLRAGDRVGVYSFASYVGAYIDLRGLGPEDVRVDERQKSVALTLPPVQVEPLGRETTLTKLHERVTGTRKGISNEERTQLQNRASELLRKKVRPGEPLHTELVLRAQDKARAYYTGVLHARGYESVSVSFDTEVYRHE